MSTIESLCKEYTDLTDEEIRKIEDVAEMLELFAGMEDADTFVDCLSSNGNAIVVAEAKPYNTPSLYNTSVVGLLARKENEPAVARTFRLGIVSRQMKAVTQENTQVLQSVGPIYHGRRVIGVLIFEKQLNVQSSIKQRLPVSQRHYNCTADALMHMLDGSSWLAEYIDEALLMVDRNGKVVFRNSLAEKLYARLGFVGDILGAQHADIQLTDYEPGNDNDHSVAETMIGDCYLSIKYVNLDDGGAAFAIMIKDITNIKVQEKELILKSVAIKEMHHRIKNNLQTIASLLRLQMRRTENQETRQVLGESMNRILSIAATHELLARGGVDNIKLGGVILNIKNNTVRYFSRPNFDVDVQIEGDDFEVESDLATTIALVINELLQNSMEYAFADKNEGKIRIVVSKGNLYSQIKVIDDGIGFDINNMDRSRLGLSIVKALVRDKLRGELRIKSDKNGTEAEFTFINNMIFHFDAVQHENLI